MSASATGWPSGLYVMRSPSDRSGRVRRLRTGFLLVRQQPTLDLDTPAVTAERSVAPYHPVARHEQRRPVAGPRLPRGPPPHRPAQPPPHPAVPARPPPPGGPPT